MLRRAGRRRADGRTECPERAMEVLVDTPPITFHNDRSLGDVGDEGIRYLAFRSICRQDRCAGVLRSSIEQEHPKTLRTLVAGKSPHTAECRQQEALLSDELPVLHGTVGSGVPLRRRDGCRLGRFGGSRRSIPSGP